MSPTFAGPLGVLASLSLIVVAIVVSMREGLGLERSIAWAAIRAVVQLTAIGLALGLILADDAPIALSFAWLVGMVTIGASTVAARTRDSGQQSANVFAIAFAALATALTVALTVVFVGRILPLQPRTVVPLSGMILGNSIAASVLAVRRTTAEVREHRDAIEVRLALGQTGRDALRPYLGAAMRTAATPQIEQTKIVGLIALPGTMTGLLLAGIDPLDAVMTQTVVMLLILGAATVTSVVIGRGLARGLITPDHRLDL